MSEMSAHSDKRSRLGASDLPQQSRERRLALHSELRDVHLQMQLLEGRARQIMLQLSDLPPIEISATDSAYAESGDTQSIEAQSMFIGIMGAAGKSMQPRFLQAQILDTALRRVDSVCVMPTGGGKSEAIFCSGLAAPSQGGRYPLSIVVTPLVELGREFVQRLNDYRPGCAILTSTSSVDSHFSRHDRDDFPEVFDAVQVSLPASPGTFEADLLHEDSRVIFVVTTAEKLSSSASFTRALTFLQDQGRIWQFVVDEAHVVERWGHYRQSYAQLGELFDAIAAGSIGSARNVPPRRLALSGTLNAIQCARCARSLRMQPSASISRVSVDRPNIIIQTLELCDQAGTKFEVLKEAVRRLAPFMATATRTLIFADTKREVRAIAKWCARFKYPSFICFRAKTERECAEVSGQREAWSATAAGSHSAPPVCVGTSYIALGLNDTVVDLVVSLCHRPNVQQIWQEVGRVGRNGQASRAIFVRHPIFLDSVCWTVDMTDMSGNRALLHQSILALSSVRLGCRRALILSALGEDDLPEYCGSCDMCTSACNIHPVIVRDEDLTCQACALLETVADCPTQGAFPYLDLLRDDHRVQICKGSISTEQMNSLVFHLLEIKALRLGSVTSVSASSKRGYSICAVTVVEENAGDLLSGRTRMVVPIRRRVQPPALVMADPPESASCNA